MKTWIPAAAVVLGLAVAARPGRGAPAARQAQDGKTVYNEQCRSCHGAAGHPTQRALAQFDSVPTFSPQFLSTLSVDSIAGIVTHGYRKNMKAFKDKLSAAEIRAVAKYVKTAFGGAAQH